MDKGLGHAVEPQSTIPIEGRGRIQRLRRAAHASDALADQRCVCPDDLYLPYVGSKGLKRFSLGALPAGEARSPPAERALYRHVIPPANRQQLLGLLATR